MAAKHDALGVHRVTPFEFAFALFSLVLGLAITCILEGFASALRDRRRARLGFLTPILGMVVIADLISFWWGAWSDRADVPVNLASLLFAALLASVYYVAASLVFPKGADATDEHDEWYFDHKLWVAGGIALANALFSLGELLVFGYVPGRPIFQALYIATALGLAVARAKWLNLLLLGLLVAFLAGTATARSAIRPTRRSRRRRLA